MKKSLVALVLAAVAVAGISGSAAASSAQRAGAKDKTIVQVAASNPQFSTLVALVKKAGLAGALSKSTLTVFAPTNDAFAALDKATLDQAMADPKGLLTTVLTNHVVEGRLTPETLAGDHKTLAGTTITVDGMGEDFTVGKAKVVCGNVQTGNATVYLIDGVLLPAS